MRRSPTATTAANDTVTAAAVDAIRSVLAALFLTIIATTEIVLGSLCAVRVLLLSPGQSDERRIRWHSRITRRDGIISRGRFQAKVAVTRSSRVGRHLWVMGPAGGISLLRHCNSTRKTTFFPHHRYSRDTTRASVPLAGIIAVAVAVTVSGQDVSRCSGKIIICVVAVAPPVVTLSFSVDASITLTFWSIS